MKTFHIPLRVVFYKENGDWVAHCLEFDLLGDGSTKEKALESLTKAIELQIEASAEYNNPRNLFSPAPGKFFEMFAAGRSIAVGNLSLCFERLTTRHPKPYVMEDVQVREYSEAEFEPEHEPV